MPEKRPRQIRDPIEARAVYNRVRQNLIARIKDPKTRAEALRLFEQSPEVIAIRRVAGLVPEDQRKRDIQAIARRNVDARERSSSRGLLSQENARRNMAFNAALGQNLFGIPEIIEAAGRYWLGGLLRDAKTTVRGKDFSDTLDIVRAEREEYKRRDPTASTVGAVAGAVIGGSGAAKGTAFLASRLASSGSKTAARAGNFLRDATTLKRGENVRNAARLAGEGAVFGGLQALGEGSDPASGAAAGAGGALALGGAVKGVRAVRNLGRAVTRPTSRSVPKALQESIRQDPQEIAAVQTEISRGTRSQAPLVSALNDGDYARVKDNLARRSDASVEIAKDATGRYLKSFMDRMLSHVNRAGQIANAQMATLGDLVQLRKDTADSIMQPIRDKRVNIKLIPFDENERQAAYDIGVRMRDLNKRAKQAFRSISDESLSTEGLSGEDLRKAQELLESWGLSEPVFASIKELDNLRRALNAASRSAETSNPANAMTFRAAAETLGDFLSSNFPEYRKMLDTYAAQSRMIEGFKTATAGKRASDIEDTKLRNDLMTTEGRIGMKAGELFRQREAVSKSPVSAIRATREYAAQGRLTRPASLDPMAAQPGTVTENMGGKAAASLADAAQQETRVLDRLLDADKLGKLGSQEDATGSLDPYNLGKSLAIAGAMPGTKVRILIDTLRGLVGDLPGPVARETAEEATRLLFSTDPNDIRRALDMLARHGITERMVAGYVQNALPASAIAANLAVSQSKETTEEELEPQETAQPEPLEGEIDPTTMSDEELLRFLEENEEGQSGYDQILDFYVQNENPDFVELVNRVMRQESGGRQFDSAGNPLSSSAGAIGVMQVMPQTAPEAARLAVLPWDEEAYYRDPAYNVLIGSAYLAEMLRRYNGDARLALVAYNAGPKRADALASGAATMADMPAETQDYVARILGN